MTSCPAPALAPWTLRASVGAMKRISPSIVLGMALLAFAACGPVAAQGPGERGIQAQGDRAVMLDALFDALANAPTRERAEMLATEIDRLLRAHPSPTVTVLFEQAGTLMSEGDHEAAREKLTGVVTLAPQLAQGWAARAEAQWGLGIYDATVSDLEAALEIEPRHFRALELLGRVREAHGDYRAALRAYRQAQAIHPRLPGIDTRIREAERKAARDAPVRHSL